MIDTIHTSPFKHGKSYRTEAGDIMKVELCDYGRYLSGTTEQNSLGIYRHALFSLDGKQWPPANGYNLIAGAIEDAAEADYSGAKTPIGIGKSHST